ncbi:MAG: type II secretion system F family protein [Actinomycetaceae bacterium]|nr:type II secretion system F family protein [Actinomycetaceae bacterium]
MTVAICFFAVIGIVLWALSIKEGRVSVVSPPWWLSWHDLLIRSGIKNLTPWKVIGLSLGSSLGVALIVLLWTKVWAVAMMTALVTLPLVHLVVTHRAASRAKILRRAWPEVIDSLVSGVRAGAGLPELLCELGTSGPEPLRPQFQAFAVDYRAEGRFGPAIDRLKERCADPVADRIVEALRLARDVGGSDLTLILRDLALLLREDARTRGELEARQSWTVNAARLAVAAPWIVLIMVSTQPGAAAAWNSTMGVLVLLFGAFACVGAYVLMQFLGRLPTDVRTMR